MTPDETAHPIEVLVEAGVLVHVGGWCDLHGLCDTKNVEGPGGQTPFRFPENTPLYALAPPPESPQEAGT